MNQQTIATSWSERCCNAIEVYKCLTDTACMLQRALIVMLIVMLPLQGTLAMLGEMSDHDSGAGIDGTSITFRGHIDTLHGGDTGDDDTGEFHCCHLTVSLAPAPQLTLTGDSNKRFFPSAHDAVRDFLVPTSIERPDWHLTHRA